MPWRQRLVQELAAKIRIAPAHQAVGIGDQRAPPIPVLGSIEAEAVLKRRFVPQLNEKPSGRKAPAQHAASAGAEP